MTSTFDYKWRPLFLIQNIYWDISFDEFKIFLLNFTNASFKFVVFVLLKDFYHQ